MEIKKVPRKELKRPLSLNKLHMLTPIAEQILAAMKLKKQNLKIYCASPTTLKNDLNVFKSTVMPEWWGVFAMYPRKELGYLEIRFNSAARVDFGFDGADFSAKPMSADEIISHAVLIRTRQSRFSRIGLTKEDMESIGKLNTMFFIYDDEAFITFTPRAETVEQAEAPNTEPTVAATTIPEKKEETSKDEYGF